MKVRGTLVGTPLSAKLTALCWGALTLLVPVAVSACTSGTTTSTPTVFSPTVTTGTASAHVTSNGVVGSDGSPGSGGGSGGASSPGTSTATATATVTPQATVTETVTVPASSIPPAAPVTGGGGTAGFQDALLLTLGAAAILAGAGGLIYRRWLGRGR
jgi:hypothetical protein